MPFSLVAIDIIGLCLAVIGFHIAFRQEVVRKLWRKLISNTQPVSEHLSEDDPARYGLRIAGTMIMVFSLTLAGMLTLFHFASR